MDWLRLNALGINFSIRPRGLPLQQVNTHICNHSTRLAGETRPRTTGILAVLARRARGTYGLFVLPIVQSRVKVTTRSFRYDHLSFQQNCLRFGKHMAHSEATGLLTAYAVLNLQALIPGKREATVTKVHSGSKAGD